MALAKQSEMSGIKIYHSALCNMLVTMSFRRLSDVRTISSGTDSASTAAISASAVSVPSPSINDTETKS